ncbi:MAG: hypothetical protein EXS35_13945 [Pedosphaera sp.]|nr:hypothetical protein [Pedosphaera sp.]
MPRLIVGHQKVFLFAGAKGLAPRPILFLEGAAIPANDQNLQAAAHYAFRKTVFAILKQIRAALGQDEARPHLQHQFARDQKSVGPQMRIGERIEKMAAQLHPERRLHPRPRGGIASLVVIPQRVRIHALVRAGRAHDSNLRPPDERVHFREPVTVQNFAERVEKAKERMVELARGQFVRPEIEPKVAHEERFGREGRGCLRVGRRFPFRLEPFENNHQIVWHPAGKMRVGLQKVLERRKAVAGPGKINSGDS